MAELLHNKRIIWTQVQLNMATAVTSLWLLPVLRGILVFITDIVIQIYAD